MRLSEIRADHYRIPLPVALSDSTHGLIEGFELVTVRVRDEDGAEGVGYTYTVGTGGAAVHAVLTRDLAPRLVGREAERIEELWQAMWRRSGACWVASIRACPVTRAVSISSSHSTRCCARPTTTWPAASAPSR